MNVRMGRRQCKNYSVDEKGMWQTNVLTRQEVRSTLDFFHGCEWVMQGIVDRFHDIVDKILSETSFTTSLTFL